MNKKRELKTGQIQIIDFYGMCRICEKFFDDVDKLKEHVDKHKKRIIN